MSLGDILTIFRLPHLRAQMRIRRDIGSFLRFHFLHAAAECGLLEALSKPASREEIHRRLEVKRPELMDGLLEMGVSLKELSRENDLYRISGRCSLALAADDGDPRVAMIQEYIAYHSSVYRHLTARLKGASLGDYLEDTGDLIARSSRIVEPFVGNFLKKTVTTLKPEKMLDIGCGSGVYLRHAVEANPNMTGAAIDMREEVIEQALVNLTEWGIGNRFKVVAADIFDLPPEITGPFDLATLFNNVYYFTLEERLALFRKIRSLLAPDGAVAIVSLMQGNTIMAANFDLILRSTVGCEPLPVMDKTIEQLRESGFSQIKKARLGFGEPFFGILAT